MIRSDAHDATASMMRRVLVEVLDSCGSFTTHCTGQVRQAGDVASDSCIIICSDGKSCTKARVGATFIGQDDLPP